MTCARHPDTPAAVFVRILHPLIEHKRDAICNACVAEWLQFPAKLTLSFEPLPKEDRASHGNTNAPAHL